MAHLDSTLTQATEFLVAFLNHGCFPSSSLHKLRQASQLEKHNYSRLAPTQRSSGGSGQEGVVWSLYALPANQRAASLPVGEPTNPSKPV